MKKHILAAALMSLGTFAGAVHAQSNVTLYGIIDAGLVFERGGPQGSVAKLGTGVQSGSRIGVRGTEDLGGGLKALFVAESGFCADGTSGGNFCTGGDRFMGRQAYVGLNGGFGTLKLGRQYSVVFNNLDTIDPFGTGLAGQSNNLVSEGGTRVNNAVSYELPGMSGFGGQIMYGLGENANDAPGGDSRNRTIGLGLNYGNGPVYVGFAYQTIDLARVGFPAENDKLQDVALGGTYDFGPAKLHAYAAKTDNDTKTTDHNDYLLGVSAPVGPGSIMASYVRRNDKTAPNQDAHQVGLGYQYDLSKRTNAYFAVAKISNDNGAGFTVGNSSDGGTGDRAYNIGVRHRF